MVNDLGDSTGSLAKSRSGIIEGIRSFYSDLLGRRDLDQESMLSFLDSLPGLGNTNPMVRFTEASTADEVARAIDKLASEKALSQMA